MYKRFCQTLAMLNNMYPNSFQGFDEYMNLVLDEAEEVHTKSKTRKTLGK